MNQNYFYICKCLTQVAGIKGISFIKAHNSTAQTRKEEDKTDKIPLKFLRLATVPQKIC